MLLIEHIYVTCIIQGIPPKMVITLNCNINILSCNNIETHVHATITG